MKLKLEIIVGCVMCKKKPHKSESKCCCAAGWINETYYNQHIT